MGYNIEVSFNILKNSSITEIQNRITHGAKLYGCDFWYEDYEYDENAQFKRNHCIITVNFSEKNIDELVKFVRFIKTMYDVYLECIYDDNSNCILYASQYYITQKMDKIRGKLYKKERRERSYSDDENMILYSIKK